MMKTSRTDRSRLGNWAWTVDHVVLFGVSALIVAGFVLSLAASPSVAARLSYDQYHFFERQLLFIVPSVLAIIGLSMMTASQVRTAGIVLFGVAFVLVIATLFFGIEVKGAKRWLHFGSFSLQPSEFLKPAFVIVSATLFAWRPKGRPVLPVLLNVGLFVASAALLVMQPDFGQTFLITAVWGTMFFMSGVPLGWVGLLSAAGLTAAFTAYQFVPHVASRIDRFLDPSSGDNYQIDRALEAFRDGGIIGLGPGEGSVKRVLPDAHTDFIFAVAAEELGLLGCLFIVFVFALIVMRGLTRAYAAEDSFVQMAATGLIVMFGLQAFINMAVNVNLLPAKGMTLPFVSYGGSSMIAIAITMGMILALTRKRARLQKQQRARPVVLSRSAPA